MGLGKGISNVVKKYCENLNSSYGGSNCSNVASVSESVTQSWASQSAPTGAQSQNSRTFCNSAEATGRAVSRDLGQSLQDQLSANAAACLDAKENITSMLEGVEVIIPSNRRSYTRPPTSLRS